MAQDSSGLLHFSWVLMCFVLALCFYAPCALKLNVSCPSRIEQMGRQREFCFRAIIRSSVLAGLVLTGCIVNQFELIMNLVGAFSECMLVFIVPTVYHLKMFGIRGRQAWEYPCYYYNPHCCLGLCHSGHLQRS
ncbi:hypothetical protein DSO57_1035735 [Entomophthora muscae]|uniref:Uncharacterized protein n=1 Tax=Entomophthora muscae TaxID=34485 RepID=A0ACC2TAR8_9FUNG|nr:hypothetical protein DSO57_1035735 [Entomophthora muscae]